jgi:hypothetical protein
MRTDAHHDKKDEHEGMVVTEHDHHGQNSDQHRSEKNTHSGRQPAKQRPDGLIRVMFTHSQLVCRKR